MIPAIPSVRSDFGLAVTVGRAWNLVLAEIRQSRTLGSFKRHMKSFLIKGFLLNVSYGLFIFFSFFVLLFCWCCTLDDARILNLYFIVG